MDERILNAALAGLLHDVGKVLQRGQEQPWKLPEGMEREGQPVHAAWTGYFIQHNVPRPFRGAALHGVYHHQPEASPAADKSLSKIVALADKLSAGERADQVEEGEQKQLPQQLVTIFDRVSLKQPRRSQDFGYLPLKPLCLVHESIFPGTADGQTSREHYAALVEVLQDAAKTGGDTLETYLESMLSAFQQATWCVPSAYYHSLPDVSLYDHSRMTAALAACLATLEPGLVASLLEAVTLDYRGDAQHPADPALLDTEVALLVGGDISGIQDFIYTISSKRAAKTLRGRSFYLQLLAEAVLRYCLSALGVPYTNVIYSGGGHFYLLAPIGAKDRLPALQKEVTLKLLTHHGTSLYLALGGVAVPVKGFKLGHFSQYWDAMHQELGLVKRRRYLELGPELYERIFKPRDTGGNPKETCQVCGEDRRTTNVMDEDRVCSLCSSFHEQIGTDLPHSRFVALGLGSPEQSRPGTAADALRAFGLEFMLLEHWGEKADFKQAQRVILWALDDPQKGDWPAGFRQPVTRWLHYLVHQVPKMSFEELEKKGKSGFERLGVLRMDVDNLGDLFSRGFGKPADPANIISLARLATLSFQVSLYFEGWVKQICSEQGGQVYVVYTGGDDLFLLGPWEIIPGLARRIRQDFADFTHGNPEIGLSGGMAFVGGKYPVYQAAEDALEAEHLAKDNPGKDAFAFLDIAWPWQTFDQVTEKQERLTQALQGVGDAGGGSGPRSIVQKLRALAQDEGQAAKARGRPVWGPWMWQGAYFLTRMAEQYKEKNPAFSQQVRAIRDELSQNDYQDISQWGTAARWAQLLIRKK